MLWLTLVALILGVFAQAYSAPFDRVLLRQRNFFARLWALVTTRLGLIRVLSIVCLYGGSFYLGLYVWDLNVWLAILVWAGVMCASFALSELVQHFTQKYTKHRKQAKQYAQTRPLSTRPD